MRFLRVIAWIFVPYIMFFVRFRKLGSGVRILAFIWAVIVPFAFVRAVASGSNDQIIAGQINSPPAQNTTAITNTHQTKETTTTAPKTNTTSKTMTAPKQPVYIQVGHPGSVGKISVTLNSLNEEKTVGTDGIDSTANGIYWILNVTVKNNDNSPRMIDESMFKIEEDGGTSYQPDTTADIYANNNNDMILQQFNPGISASGNIVFDMPDAMTYGHIGEHYVLVVSSGFSQTEFALP